MEIKDAIEVAYNNGRKRAIAEVFEELDKLLTVDISHSYMDGLFILNQKRYKDLKDSLTNEK